MAKRLAKKEWIKQDVHSLAKERVRVAYDQFDTVVVMFSGGKDSTAALHVTLEVAEERGIEKVPVFFYDEEAIPYETEEYCRRVANRPDVEFHWLCIPVKHRNAASKKHPYWWPWAPESEDLWCRPLPPEAITTLDGFPMDQDQRLSIPDANGLVFPPDVYGNVGCVMGIRCDESLTRLQAILSNSGRENHWIVKFNEGTARGNFWKVYPIYDWKTADVWAAPKKHGWDYNRAYDVMDKIGISPSSQRVAPPFGEEPLQALHHFKEAWPEIWAKMSMRVPGANTAGLYCQTDLYAFNKFPEKPDGISWSNFILSHIEKHPAHLQADVADRIKEHYEAHFKRTKEPIMVRAVHPETGVSWNFLLKIAIRGDFKGRQKRKHAFTHQEYLDRKRKYERERAKSLQADAE